LTGPEIHLDFETFSEMKFGRSKLAVGSRRYAAHHSTLVLCLGWAIDDERPRIWIPSDPPPPRLFDAIATKGATVHAWNAGFEMAVWEEVCVPRMGWPEIPFEAWRDTAAVAMAHALPWKLEETLKALGLPGKDPAGDRLVSKLCAPRRSSKANSDNRWTPATKPADFHALYEYCMTDVERERSVLDELPYPDLSPEELFAWRETMLLNRRGWPVDLESVERMIDVLEQDRKRLLAELVKITDGELTSAAQVAKSLAWLRDRGAHLDDYRKDTVEAALKTELPPECRRVLEIRQHLAKSSVKKYEAISWRASEDGTIKDLIAYHGASTGRDAGRGVQIQNFVRKNITSSEDHDDINLAVETAVRALKTERPLDAIEILYGEVTTFAAKMSRPMLVASEGHELFAGDLSQIENRTVLWLADCPFGIDVYNRGLDEYRTFASGFYNVDYGDVTPAQRQHCKGAVLGCVFGMGWKTYIAQAIAFGQEPPTEAKARETVDGYRAQYPEVVDLWRGLNRAAMEAIERRGRSRYQKITFEYDDDFDFLFMILPSGRRLSYYRPRVRLMETPWGAMKETVTAMGMGTNFKWERRKITPGRWTENAVQAIARDVMFFAVRRIIEAGYLQVGRVHDEIISQRLLGEGDLDEYVGFMTNPPWMRGIPITADGWKGTRYRK